MNNLQPDWWNHPLPDYLGQHPTNYVLNEAELNAVASALAAMNIALTKECEHVAGALRVMRTHRVPMRVPGSHMPLPVCVNDVLKLMLTLGRSTKFLTEVLELMAKKRGESEQAELRG